MQCQLNLEDPCTTVDVTLTRLQEYSHSQRNIAVDRVAFHTRMQGEMESFDRFRVDLTHIAEDAELCSHCRESQMVTQILVGTKDDHAKQLLFQRDSSPHCRR